MALFSVSDTSGALPQKGGAGRRGGGRKADLRQFRTGAQLTTPLPFGRRIYDMIKADLAAWYLRNRLYHFKKNRSHEEWTKRELFLKWMAGLPTNDPNGWYQKHREHWFGHYVLLDWALDIPSSKSRNQRLARLSDVLVGEVDKTVDTTNFQLHIRLNHEGLRRYAISYLVFGSTSNIRRVIYGIIALPGLYFYVNLAKSIFNS